MKSTLAFTLLLILFTAAAGLAQEPISLRFLCYEDGNECALYAELLERFSQEHPGIVVAVETLSKDQISAELSRAVADGARPDLARIADFDAQAGHYLDLRPLLAAPEALEANFQAPFLAALRGFADDEGWYGYPDALGVVAPFVNASAFAEAGEPLPDADASWDDWLSALERVADATGIPYALAVDNKDHRLAAPAMSLGATYFDAEGQLVLPEDSGLRDILRILQGLMAAGRAPADTLLGTGKAQDYFTRGDTVMYICGSWKVASVAADVEKAFDWAIVPNPAGAGGSTGVAQASAIVAMAGTDHPQAAASVIAWLLQPEIVAEFAARALTIPAHLSLAAEWIDYDAGQRRDRVGAECLRA